MKNAPQSKNCISYWLNILRKSGVHIPKTIVVHAEPTVAFPEIEKDKLDPVSPRFLRLIHEMVAQVGGYPVFLRTGLTAAKHDWNETCYVESKDHLAHNIRTLALYALIHGLSIRVWAVRQFLDLDTRFVAFSGHMPIGREWRYFIDGGRVVCAHPYWPEDTIQDVVGTPNWKDLLAALNDEAFEIEARHEIIEQVAKAFEGAWSVDICRLRAGGWVVTDMAMAGQSFHWPGCPYEKLA